MDFVHDQLFDGRKIRILTIVDTFSRRSPAIDVRLSYRGNDVVETLERVIQESGCPKTIVSTMVRNLSAGSSIYGPSCAAPHSTSADPASRPTTHLLKA
jgi:hypothetical protein